MKRLDIDHNTFDEHFPHQSFAIRHHLCDSPLFQLPRLIELSRTLPEEMVEYNAGNLAVGQDPNVTPRTGLSIEETIKQIEEVQSWMVLKRVDLDAEYKALLDACLDEVTYRASRFVSPSGEREAFVFITSPNSVTPYHFDPEHNFLLQIRGSKMMHTFDRNDRIMLPEEEIEAKFLDQYGTRNLPFEESFQEKARSFELRPGDGVFVPVTMPHWVANGSEVSISFSITFYSHEIRRTSRIYRMNGQLRRMGLRPTPVGKSPLVDSTKYGAYMTMRGVKRLLGKG